MKLEKIINKLELEYPQVLQEDWDCSGLLFEGKEDVTKVLVTLDVTPNIANYAIHNNFDLIISHHPIIFGSYLQTYDYVRQTYQKLIRKNISLYSMHTNFDNHGNGMNYQYIKKIGYTPNNENGMLRTFDADEHFIKQLINKVKNIRIYNIHNNISKVGVLLGAGGSLIEEVTKLNCDTFISSEFKHHEILYAKEHNIMLLDVTHQAEGIFCNIIAEYLLDEPNLEVEVYKDNYEVDILSKQ